MPDLSLEPCGDGVELRLEGKAINQQGWLRAIFWVHDAGKGIYIVDLFWKKTNKISVADIHRANHRIRQLKALLAAGTPGNQGSRSLTSTPKAAASFCRVFCCGKCSPVSMTAM